MNNVQRWKKNSSFRSYIHFEDILSFRVSPEYLNLKLFITLKLFPEQTQKSWNIQNPRLRTFLIYPAKI